jgi:GrpB-like predicted nucleotidyltransferase (UPF0157 family)
MIEVVEYREAWPERFTELRAAYGEALRIAGVHVQKIEHVGSTAVPGLSAKPVIDVDVVVTSAEADAAVAALAGLGFMPRGDLGIPGRLAFSAPARFAPTNTYVVEGNSLALRNHLAVRDVLRADPALRDEYGEVKRRAAASAADIDEYLLLKSDVLDRILRRAGLSDDDRAEIAATNRSITVRGAQG